MNTNEKIKATGELKIEVTGPDGKLKQSVVVPNMVVTAGLGHIASRMKDTTQAAMTHMAVGTTNTAAALGNTTLAVEVARVALTSTTVTGAGIAYVGTFPPGTGTAALVEAGLFNATPAGVMLCRTVFGTVTKDAGDTLVITWTVTLS